MQIYVELVLYLAVFFFLLSQKSFYRVVSGLSVFGKSILLIAAFFLIFSQLHKKNSDTYPFTYWGMYASKHPSSSYNEYILTLDDSTTTHYPFKQITVTSPRAFMRKLDNLLLNKNWDLLEETMQSLIDIFQEKYPGKQVSQLEIHRITLGEFAADGISKEQKTMFIYVNE